jgi:hypothetical protein
VRPRRQSLALFFLAVATCALLVVSLLVGQPGKDICIGLALIAAAFVALLAFV